MQFIDSRYIMINESKLIEGEVTLRDLRLSGEVSETRRSIIRWIALTIGIINPGESRQSAVSVLDAILYFQFSLKKDPSVYELSEYITTNWAPINEKTLRYHLLQFKKAKIVNNEKGRYFIFNPQIGNKYDENVWVNSYIDSIMSPIKEKMVLALKELKNR